MHIYIYTLNFDIIEKSISSWCNEVIRTLYVFHHLSEATIKVQVNYIYDISIKFHPLNLIN